VRTFVVLVALTGLGALAGLLLTRWVVIPTMGAGNVERLVALGRHIDAGASPEVVFLGTSVAVESIDAERVAAHLPTGWTAENWSINGCAIKEVRLILPKVLRAKPRYVVLNLLPNDLGDPDDIEIEKAYGYGLGGFGAAWPDGDPMALFPGISPATADAMRSTTFEQAMHFRSTPLDVANRELRDRVRSGLRRTASDDWIAPYELETGIEGARLDRHVGEAVAAIEARTAGAGDAGAKALRGAVDEIVRGGARAVVCFAPQHPALRERVGPILDRVRTLGASIESRPDVVFFDASELFGAEGFADAVHPNAVGREAFSEAVGRVIADLERTGEER
jgi:hypothetical protein